MDQSLTRTHEGSGIGLSLVKSLIEIQSGKITVRSEVGKGSEFIVELPITVLEDDKGDQTDENCITKYFIPDEKTREEFSDIYID